jgi:hypothetical protein
VLKRGVGRPEFVDRPGTKFQEDGAGDPAIQVSCKRNESQSRVDDDVMNELEESYRLWRQAMPASRPAVQSVEGLHGLPGLKVFYLNTFPTAPLDVAPVRIMDLVSLERGIALDTKTMNHELLTRDGSNQVLRSAAQFDIVPTLANPDFIQRFPERVQGNPFP